MTKKYELTNENIEYESKTLYRIRALKNFSDVKAGDLGGFVESEENLSHKGDSWIYDDSKVVGTSRIKGCSKVKGCSTIVNSKIKNRSIITYSSVVKNCSVSDNSIVDNSIVDYSVVMKNSIIDNSIVGGNADSSTIINSKVINSAVDNSRVNNSTVDNSSVNDSKVYNSSVNDSTVDNFRVGDSVFGGIRCRFNNARIDHTSEYITIARIGSRGDTLTAYRCADGKIGVATGCFKGSIDEFVDAVKETHGDNTYGIQYLKAVELIKHVLMCGETVTKGNDYEHQTSN